MPNKINEIGNRYGRLVVVRKAPSRLGSIYWRCKCDCGNYKTVRGSSLHCGETTSCGCRRRESVSNANKKNELGKRYGKLLVVGESHNRYGRYYVCWYCKCDCGNEIEVNGSLLRQGRVKSCGCQPRRRKKN